MSRLEISARWPGLGAPSAAARSLASSTLVGDLSVASPSPTDPRCLALVAITPPGAACASAASLSHADSRGCDWSAYNRRPHGAIAQLGERLPCKQEVAGSNPAGSITGCLMTGS